MNPTTITFLRKLTHASIVSLYTAFGLLTAITLINRARKEAGNCVYEVGSISHKTEGKTRRQF